MPVGPITYKGGMWKKRSVFYTSSSAISQGYGVAYNRDVGTAANVDEERDWQVEGLTYANAIDFAGVTVRDYAAKTGGQVIEIYLPGGLAKVYTSETSLTVNAARIHCRADTTAPGVFIEAGGMKGPGSAQVLQTISAAGLCLVYLDEGDQNGCVEVRADATGGAKTLMVGGLTTFSAATMASADATFTVAAGSFIGQMKAFQCEGTIGTNEWLITVNGVRIDGSTTLATAEFNADGEDLTLMYMGDYWHQMNETTATLT